MPTFNQGDILYTGSPTIPANYQWNPKSTGGTTGYGYWGSAPGPNYQPAPMQWSNYMDPGTPIGYSGIMPEYGGSSGVGGAGYKSAAAGGGGPLLQMDTGLSSGIEFPPADMSPQYTTAPPAAPQYAQQGGFIQVNAGDNAGSTLGTDPSGAGLATSSLGFNYSPAPDGGYYVYDSNWNYVGSVPGSGTSATPQTAQGTPTSSSTPSQPAAPAAADTSYSTPYATQTQQTAPATIGSGFYGGSTSFGSASSGLYGGLEGGLSTGSVGGFSGMADAGLGGGMGPPNVMRYL